MAIVFENHNEPHVELIQIGDETHYRIPEAAQVMNLDADSVGRLLEFGELSGFSVAEVIFVFESSIDE
jgi:hypothetical protein